MSTQLSLWTIYQGVISANNASKTDQEIVSDILNKGVGIIVSYKTSNIGNKVVKDRTSILIGSSLLGGFSENMSLPERMNSEDKK